MIQITETHALKYVQLVILVVNKVILVLNVILLVENAQDQALMTVIVVIMVFT